MNDIINGLRASRAEMHAPSETWRMLHMLSPALLQQAVKPIPRIFPIADVLILEAGFESVELRLSQAWGAF